MSSILVTGATSGIGQVTAVELAKLGHTVGVHGRDEAKATAVAESIVQSGGRADVFVADLASLGAVASLASDVHSRWGSLDVLLNNAGLINTARLESAEGFELTWAVNHLAPFLLTRLLLDPLRAAQGRVVCVASDAHFGVSVPFDDIDAERSFSGWKRYQASKLMNVLFASALARREPTLTAVSLHPGFVASNFGMNSGWMKWIMRLSRPIQLSQDDGAKTSIWCATTDGLRSGAYHAKCAEKAPSRQAQVEASAERLWALSEERVAPFLS